MFYKGKRCFSLFSTKQNIGLHVDKIKAAVLSVIIQFEISAQAIRKKMCF